MQTARPGTTEPSVSAKLATKGTHTVQFAPKVRRKILAFFNVIDRIDNHSLLLLFLQSQYQKKNAPLTKIVLVCNLVCKRNARTHVRLYCHVLPMQNAQSTTAYP